MPEQPHQPSQPTHGPLILIIEDELPIRRFLRATLTSNGYRIAEAATANDGIRQAATIQPEVIMLDLGLPDLDGLEVARQLRSWTSIPIIVLSARGQESDKIAALDAGADDYLTKPFGTGELLARIRVMLRRASLAATQGSGEPVIAVGDLRIDLALRQIWRGDTEIHLTPIQYNLLRALARNIGRVMTHKQLLHEAWGAGYEEDPQYVRVYMSQLRHKLEADPTRPRYLVTEPGVGYRLKID
ncbi:MAG: response regulator [Roseiflexaceae bacterium]|nr:response regulator [Roseiflexaceae bacterium]